MTKCAGGGGGAEETNVRLLKKLENTAHIGRFEM